MSKVMLVNPRSRRKTTRKRRTPAQRAATRRLVAANRAKRKSPSVRRRKRTTARRVRRNPISSKSIFKNVLDRQIKPAAVMASGALITDLAYGQLERFVPPVLTDGAVRHVTKGVLAIAISAVAGNLKLGRAPLLNDLAKGSLTVVMHDAAKEFISATMPALNLGYYSAAPLGMYTNSVPSQFTPEGQYTPNYLNNDGGMGMYINSNQSYQNEAYDSSFEI